MPLPSFLQRKDKANRATAVAEDAGPVQEARVRARRRLVGAVVLLAVGIVGFPLLFETQPRPMPADIPINVAGKDLPVQRPTRVAPPPVVELPADAGNETPVGASTAGSSMTSAPVAVDASATSANPASAAEESRPLAVAAAQASVPAVSASAAPPKRPVPPKPSEEAARSKPAAEAKPAPPAASADVRAGRFVVQVGAYTDLAAMRDARQRVEKLGFKTYTQEVDTPSGRRTRLRVGPFASRSEAESAGARLKAVGMPGNLLVL